MFVYVEACAHECRCLRRPEEGVRSYRARITVGCELPVVGTGIEDCVRSTGSGSTDGCEPPFGYWELNLVLWKSSHLSTPFIHLLVLSVYLFLYVCMCEQ